MADATDNEDSAHSARALDDESGVPCVLAPSRPLRRFLFGVGVLLAAMVCVRLWWGWVAHNRLERAIQTLVAAGEPIYPEDFDEEPVPDEKNAAVLIRQAEEALNVTPQISQSARWHLARSYGSTLPETATILDTWWPAWEAFVASNAEALDLVVKALAKPGIEWGIRFRKPVWPGPTLSCLNQRYLGGLLCHKAISRYHDGDHAGMLLALRKVFAHARLVSAQPTLIAHLVSGASQRRALSVLEAAGPMVAKALADTETSRQGKKYDTRREALALMADLLDDGYYHSRLADALRLERCWYLGVGRMVLDGELTMRSLQTTGQTIPPSPRQLVLNRLRRPILELDVVRMMNRSTAIIAAVAEPTWPEAAAKLPDEIGFFPRPVIDLSPLSRRLTSSLDQAITGHFELLAHRRMAALALAIWCYRADYGRWPETLSELIPEYLSTLPRGPFAADENTFAYAQSGYERRLYSVWRNGVDDGGVVIMRGAGWIDREKSDLVFKLGGVRPKTDAAPQ